jgi:hypothetical protein
MSEHDAVAAAIAKFPRALDPPFPFGDADAPVEIHRGPLEIDQLERTMRTEDGILSFGWRPSCGIRFCGSFVGAVPVKLGPIELRLLALNAQEVLAAEVTRTEIGPAAVVEGRIEHRGGHASGPIHELRFLLPNLAPLFGEAITNGRAVWAGRVALFDEEWDVQLDQRHDATSVWSEVRGGAYAFIYSGRLVSAVDSPLEPASSKDALDALMYFLSLFSGAWTPPLLIVGCDRDGVIRWRDWTTRLISPPEPRLRLLDRHHPEILVDSWNGFLRRWRQPAWREPITTAIRLFVEANGPVTVEASLVLVQTALELLAMVLVVEVEKTMSASEFDAIRPASNKLRPLLQRAGLPIEIPSQLVQLKSMAEDAGWEDGLHAITGLRNAFVHPAQRALIHESEPVPRIELRELALWYLELSLLWLFDYAAVYSNRLATIRRVGRVEHVPWADPQH